MQPTALCLDKVIKNPRTVYYGCRGATWLSALCPPSERRKTCLGPKGGRPRWEGNSQSRLHILSSPGRAWAPHAQPVLLDLPCCESQRREKGGVAFCWRSLVPKPGSFQSREAVHRLRYQDLGAVATRPSTGGRNLCDALPPRRGARRMLWSSW